MPNLFRTLDGREWKASQLISFTVADGTKVEAVWAGSATEEKLDQWLRPPGSELSQSEEVTAVATKSDDTKELIWADAPAGAHLFFVLMAKEAGKDYRLAKMVTTAASAAQSAYLHHDRFCLFGKLRLNGTMEIIPPLDPPPPRPPDQRELF